MFCGLCGFSAVLATRAAAVPLPQQVGAEVEIAVETEHPYGPAEPGTVMDVFELSKPGASYIKLHFSRFELRDGDTVEIWSGGARIHTIENGDYDADAFWSPLVLGDELTVKLTYGSAANAQAYGFVIDRYAAGYPGLFDDGAPEGETDDSVYSAQRSVCGSTDWKDIECVRNSDADAYRNGRATAKLIIGGSSMCTGFLVSSKNHFITNNHCVSSKNGVQSTDVIFTYQRSTCGGSKNAATTTVRGENMIVTSGELDMTLMTVRGNPAATFGYVTFADRDARKGEEIYITEHPRGLPKKIAYGPVESVGQINIGYNTDTDGGSSGSPVFLASSHLVVGLHHLGGCPNKAVRGTLVYNKIKDHLPVGILAADEPEKVVPPGGTAQYLVRVSNNSGASTAFDLALSHPNQAAVFADSAQSSLRVPSVAAGAHVDVAIDVTVDANTAEGTRIAFDVTARATKTGLEDALTLNTVVRTIRDAIVESNGLHDSGDPDTTVVYDVSIKNVGNVVDDYTLRLKGGLFPIQFADSGDATAALSGIAPGDTASVVIEVTIPAGTLAGEASEATLRLSNESGNLSRESSVVTDVNAVYAVEAVYGTEPSQRTDPGQTVEFEMEIVNRGNVRDSFTLSEIQSAGGFPTTVAPTRVELEPSGTPGDRATVRVTVQVPELPDRIRNASNKLVLDRANALLALNLQSESSPDATERVEFKTTVNGIAAVTAVVHNGNLGGGTAGDVTVYEVTIENRGLFADSYQLLVSDEGAPAELAQDMVGQLPPGESETIEIRVELDSDTEKAYVSVLSVQDDQARVDLALNARADYTLVGVSCQQTSSSPPLAPILALVVVLLLRVRQRGCRFSPILARKRHSRAGGNPGDRDAA